jgi:hypothetical protein
MKQHNHVATADIKAALAIRRLPMADNPAILQAFPDCLRILGLDVHATIPCTATGDLVSNLAWMVDPRDVLAACSKSKVAVVSMEHDGKDIIGLSVNGIAIPGRSGNGIPDCVPDEFGPHGWRFWQQLPLDSVDWRKLLDCSPANDLRKVLLGAGIVSRNGERYIAGTDGCVLYWEQLPLDICPDLPDSVQIARETVKLLARPKATAVSLWHDGDSAHNPVVVWREGNVSFVDCATDAGRYPNCRAVFPAECQYSATIARPQALLEWFERLPNPPKGKTCAAMFLENGDCVADWCENTFPDATAGMPFDMCLDLGYLKALIGKTQGAITLGLNNPGTPAVLGDWGLIMPIK